jgi:hypothetical protein
MPEIDLDFGSVGKVPEGWFRLTVDKAIFKPNKSRDGYIINLQMRLIDLPSGNLPGTDTPYEAFENMMVFENASMKLSARKFLQEKLNAITGEDWDADGMKLKVDCGLCEDDSCDHEKHVPALEDQTVVGLIIGEDYEGRLQARVSRWLPDDGSVDFGPNVTE